MMILFDLLLLGALLLVADTLVRVLDDCPRSDSHTPSYGEW